MTPTRRDFLRTAGTVGAGLAVGGAVACGVEAGSGASASVVPTPKKLLILGGTGFIGPHMVRYAVGRGQEGTVFPGGRAGAPACVTWGCF